jgi:predicted phosphoribosyltransferase
MVDAIKRGSVRASRGGFGYRDDVGGSSTFSDRRAAGRELALQLSDYSGRDDVVVLGLPRGGVPVAYEVALALDAPLDVFVVRKLGVPGREELAMGAIASGGVLVTNREVLVAARIAPNEIETAIERERAELGRRERLYRGGLQAIDLHGRIALVVDDGLATGATMRAAIEALRRRAARAVVVAVPIAAPTTCRELARHADGIVCAHTAEPLIAVGVWYRDFTATSDEEVRDLLEEAADRREVGASGYEEAAKPDEGTDPRP